MQALPFFLLVLPLLIPSTRSIAGSTSSPTQFSSMTSITSLTTPIEDENSFTHGLLLKPPFFLSSEPTSKLLPISSALPRSTLSISVLSVLFSEPSSSTLASASLHGTKTQQISTDSYQTPTATIISPNPFLTSLPSRLYPRVSLDLDQVVHSVHSFRMIGILFDLELNWEFVVEGPSSSSQIFAFLPVNIATALGIPSDQVKSWILSVYVTPSYHDPEDAALLGTLWLGYIPGDLINTLQKQIKDNQSAFYTGDSDFIGQSIAKHVNQGFNITSIVDPNLNQSASFSSNSGGNRRNDNLKAVIIGVAIAVSIIAVLVLIFLVYRSFRRLHGYAHRI